VTRVVETMTLLKIRNEETNAARDALSVVFEKQLFTQTYSKLDESQLLFCDMSVVG
jgi:hypothetical protein